MSLEFDPACSTLQPEDSLQIYIPAIEYVSDQKCGSVPKDEDDSPNMPFWAILNKFCGRYVLLLYISLKYKIYTSISMITAIYIALAVSIIYSAVN